MENFEFISPTRLVFGIGSESRTGELCARYSKKILVVTSFGKTNASGIVDRALASLKEAGVEYELLTGIVTNPRISKVREGLDTVRKNDIGFILAIGGGSIIDTAKAIGMGACYGGDVWELYEHKAVPEKTLPVGVVLTLSAAGSEFSNSSVISDEATQMKLSINNDISRPVFAIENPEVLLSVPDHLLYCGIADMFAHILERYHTITPNVDFTDRIAEGAMKCIIENSRLLLKNRTDINVLSQLMLAATFAHNGIFGMGSTGEWAAHGLGVPPSALYDSIHGATLTAIIPSWLSYIIPYNLPRAVKLAMRVFDVDPNGKTDTEIAEEGIAAMKSWFAEIGTPTSLTELGVPTDERGIDALVDKYCQKAARGVCKKLERDDVRIIYNAAI